jgi:RNA polymerase sigma factor (sigma-70 family)
MTANDIPPPVTELVEAATRGDDVAWTALVTQYQPLIHAVCRRFHLSPVDTDDVTQTLWLRLVAHIGRLREPRALPGWIETTTRNLCRNALRQGNRSVPHDPQQIGSMWSVADGGDQAGIDEELLRAECRNAVQDGLAELPQRQQALFRLLAADPPLSYQQIGERLGMPVGSIGPTRARCLAKLRTTALVRTFLVEPTSEPASAA